MTFHWGYCQHKQYPYYPRHCRISSDQYKTNTQEEKTYYVGVCLRQEVTKRILHNYRHCPPSQTVDKKGECLDAFRACRQMENEAFFTINQCDHKPVEVLIKSSRCKLGFQPDLKNESLLFRSLRDFLEDEEDNDDYDIDYEEDYHDDSWYVDYEHYHVDLTRF